MTAIDLVLIGAASVFGLMLFLWLIHFPMKNAAIVDGGWAGGLALVAILYAALSPGYGPRRLLLAAMGGIWGLRLAIYLLSTRVFGHPEEGRYVALRAKWKTGIGWKFFIFFEVQAVLVVILSVPFLVMARNRTSQLLPVEVIAAVLWLIAVSFESLADRQLHRFKSDPANQGKTCRVGLWNYSRHPNYFFEWFIWIAFALAGVSGPYGWWGFTAPAIMLYFLFRLSGIPATERQALRTKGDDYRRYQETTSAFIPWFPRKIETK